jgi:copper-containing nitrite reductase
LNLARSGRGAFYTSRRGSRSGFTDQDHKRRNYSQSSSKKYSESCASDKLRFVLFDLTPASAGLLTIAALLNGILGSSTSNDKKTQLNVDADNKTKPNNSDENVSDFPVVTAELTVPPNVPQPISRKYPVHLIVDMSVLIQQMSIDGSYDYEFWTYNGSVPGPFIRARVGDVMEVKLTNKDESGMLHNIDFHAVTGPGGGAAVLTTGPPPFTPVKTAMFRLMAPGLFLYHCSVTPVGVHISNGMFGLILVEPEEGLPPVDKEFYVVQSEIYADEPEPGSRLLPLSEERGYRSDPSYVVFNGKVGSLTEERTLQARTNEKIRLFFGNAGPNLVSSFHIIGMIFDKVYREGDLISPPARNLQTTVVPAGGAVIIEFSSPVPGTYTLTDHSIFRIEKGCVGFLNLTGEPRDDIYFSKEAPQNCPSCKHHK